MDNKDILDISSFNTITKDLLSAMIEAIKDKDGDRLEDISRNLSGWWGGECLCFAHEESECVCGAWDKVDD